MFLYPLTRSNRLRLARAFAKVPRVDISIDCVLEDQMGKAFVDSLENPQYFMMEIDSFFCFFAGDFTREAGRSFLAETPNGRMLMSGSSGWQAVDELFTERLIKIQRHNHASETLSKPHLQQIIDSSLHNPSIRRVDVALAETHPPFLEYAAFDSAEDFVERGIGFCMMRDGAVIGAAYSSLVCSNAIEVSVVVDSAYRQQGIAKVLCAHLLSWCLENGLSPHWDAANEESCLLAEKLGYRKLHDYTAYFLKPSA
jgi:GNAT superfamily N-acetyltransferase